MPAFIRYPFFGCVILALSACGSSGSSRLLEPAAPAMPDDPPTQPSASYPGVDYLIDDIQDAIGEFAAVLLQVYRDADGNKYLLTTTNVADMDLTGVDLPTGVDTAPDFADLLAVYEDEDGNEYLLTPDNIADMDLTGVDLPTGVDTAPDFADLTKVRDGGGMGARRLSRNPAALDTLRRSILLLSNRYLSTGAVLARTDDGSVETERSAATCVDGTGTFANCTFGMDTLREEETTFHLGPESSSGENQVSFRSFKADREPVMGYRDVLMSQVRTSDTGESDLLQVYKDAEGNKYLLTNTNVADMDLEDVVLPEGVTERPEFADLFAVYEDEDDNEYLLTPDNVADMNLEDVKLPEGVTEEMAPAFADLTKVRDGEAVGYEYVGYDGMLRYSMFFVGVYRFFDNDDTLEHLRFENASLGQIYDEEPLKSGIQSPSVALTGEGVMVGMEREKESLEHFLVQGDVEINYSPFDNNETPDVTTDDMDAMIDISITEIKRLVGDGDAWYAGNTYSTALTWNNLEVEGSKFSGGDLSPLTATPGKLEGSFYGTEDDPEVGGVFHHESLRHEIIGSFGSKLDPVPEDDDDMMDQ